ncbi:hypothetical protein HU200_007489 [Digitaria exilis]|uniref:Uncharacterized protein n=1 Tax=Digitaria exilis TaxID=1010633 RepID=A0A835FQW6_9POAL|nr:hypothetical protein HU200_007489 [Digitaria exilis]
MIRCTSSRQAHHLHDSPPFHLFKEGKRGFRNSIGGVHCTGPRPLNPTFVEMPFFGVPDGLVRRGQRPASQKSAMVSSYRSLLLYLVGAEDFIRSLALRQCLYVYFGISLLELLMFTLVEMA